MGKRQRELLRKIRALRARDWLELLEAQLLLVRAQLIVFTRPRGGLIDGELPESGDAPTRLPASDVAQRLGVAVSRAARFGLFRPKCLVRSLALQRMIERHGIEGSRIRIGVRRDGEQGERLTAHAWVEYGDLVLGDHDDHVATFTRLADVRMKSS